MTHSLILSPHEVLPALRGELELVVRPISLRHVHDIDDAGDPMRECRDGIWRKAPCPLGVPGDRLVCKETWADVNTDGGPAFTYRADNGLHFCQDDAFPVEYERYPGMSFAMWCGDLWRGEPGHTWRKAQHMPAWASRITLENCGVRVMRCGDLTDVDAELCGIQATPCGGCGATRSEDRCIGCLHPFYLDGLRETWNRRYGRRYPWESNPFVWAVGVKRVEG
jgi:hypothetical protein